MKKLLNLGLCAFFAATGLSAFAADLPQATSVNPTNSGGVVLDGGYTSYSYPWMVLTWEGKELSFKEGAAKTVTITSTAPDTNKSGQVPIGFGPGNSASAKDASGTYLVVDIEDGDGLYAKGYSYSFTLPAGTVVDSEGNENPEQVFTYTCATALTALSNSNNAQCINPQASYISSVSGVSPYYSASELTNVTITYPGDYSLEATDTPGLQITAKGVKNTEAQVCEYNIADGKINLNLSSLAPDTYTLTIPAGLVKATNGSTLYTNPASSTVVFIIVGELGELTDEPSYYAGYMSTPLATYVTSFPNSILVSFDGQPIEINSESTENATITYGDESIKLTADIATQNQGIYTLKLTPASIPVTLGQYTINIPAGLVKSGEFTNQALTQTFNYVQSLSTYTVEPAAGTMNISSFKEITIEYPGARKIEVVGENGTITLNPNSSDDDDDDFGGVGGLAEGDQENNPNKIEVVLGENMNITNGKIVVTLPENLSTGTLTLNFPANYFLVDGQTVNPTINLVYTLWDNMDSAIVLEGLQGAYSSPDVKFLLTWDYQTIEKTDDFSLVLQRQGSNLEYPADAVTLISIEDPEGNTPEQPNALSIDFSEFFSNYDGGIPGTGLMNLSLKLAEGSVMNSDEKINPAQELSSNFRIYNPVQGNFSWQDTETPGVYSFVWGETANISSVSYTAGTYYIILTAKDGTEYQIPYKAYNSFTPGSWTYVTASKNYQVNLSNIPDGDYTVTIPNGLVNIRYTDATTTTYCTNSTYTFDFTLGNPVEVNIAFVGENLEEAAESYVDVIYNEGEYQTALNVSNSAYSFDLAADATITFTPNERYVVALSSTVTDTDVVSVTTDEDGVVTVALNYSAITQEMDITKIDLTATVSLIQPVSVTLSFIAAEGVEETNVYELVTSSAETGDNGELLDEFAVDSNLYTFSAYPEVDLSFVPVEGYVISVTSNVAAVSVEEGTDGEWTAVVGENVEGDVTLTITVSEIVQPVSVTLNFIAGEGVEETNVYELVTSSAEAGDNGELLDEFAVDSNLYTFSAYPEIDLSFVPVEGYVISGITSNVAAVSVEEGTDGEWTAVVGENVEGDVTLTITVSEEETVSINRLGIDGIDGAIYTLQGIKIDRNALVPGIYIINGKKTVIK